MTVSKIEAVQSKLEKKEKKKKILWHSKRQIQDLGAEVRATQSMILETSFHTVQAIDGNKAPLREWVKTY